MLRQLFLVILLNITALSTRAQQDAPDLLLSKLMRKMSAVTVFNYTQYRHFHYKDDNYDHKDTLQLVLDYPGARSPILPRHQVRDLGRRITYIYNNSDRFVLSEDNKALDLEPDNSEANISKSNYFRQSYANLKAMLPEIIDRTDITKTARDTVVQGTRCSIVRFYFPGKRLDPLMGYYDMKTDTLKWVYEIYIDRNTYLPKAFNVLIERPAHAEDYITSFYANTSSKAMLPGLTSWNYSAYRAAYPNHTAKRKDLIKTGSPLPAFTLPVYVDAQTTDSLRFNGQPTLLVFWTKNCGYCMAALPKLPALQARLAAKGVQLIAVNCGDPREDIATFKTKFGASFPMCYNGAPLAAELGLYGYPMTMMVDKEGKVTEIAVFDDKRN